MDGYITIGTELDTKSFDKEIASLESKLNDIESTLKMASEDKTLFSTSEIREMEKEAEKLKNRIIDLKKKQQDTGKMDFSQFKFSIEDVIKKVTKWGLALFGIRSAYNFIRQSVSTLSQYDEQLATDVEYIRYALATTLKPVIEYIINLAYKLLAYTGYIAKAWFNVNIFANASVNSFQKTNKAIKETNKSAKELNKTLAGFDEMNILQESGSVSSGGGGGGVTLPKIDLAEWQNVKIPEWVKWISKNGKLLATILLGIGTAIASIKFAKFIKGITGANSSMGKFSSGIMLIVGGLTSLIAIMIDAVHNWDNLTTSEKAAKTALALLSTAMIAFGAMMLGASGPVGVIIALIAVIGSAVIAMATEEKAIKSVKKAEEDLADAKKKTKEAYNDYINAVDRAEEAMNSLIDVQNRTGISGEELNRQVEEGIIDYKNMTVEQKEVYKAYVNNINAQQELTDSTKQLKEAKNEEKIASWETRLAVMAEKGQYEEYRDAVVDAFNNGELSAEQARKLIGKAMTEMDKDTQKTFSENIPNEIKQGLDPSQYQTTWQKFKSNWKSHLADLSTKILFSFDFTSSGVINSLRKKIFGFAKGGIVVPRLASGGIINQPGRGVPLTSAIGGERGAEGVIPLTDSQQMELLGESIGKYITINATIPVYAYNRQVDKQIKRIQAEDDFAFNR